MTKVLFVGGGSVGHIAPGVAVWRAFKERNPDAEALFVCTARGDDTTFLEAEHLPYKIIDAPRISISFPLKFIKALRQAKFVISSFHPDVIFSKGGYVSIPVCLAARLCKIPIVLHESDVVSGRANWLVSKWAEHLCTGFPSTLATSDERRASTYTGNPIRKSITEGNRDEGLRITGFTGDRPILLVMGGSQGAQSINDAIEKLLPEMVQTFDVIHITGRGKEIAYQDDHYWSQPFVTDELAHLHAIADLAISRSGAGSIAELAANGIPGILVPLRSVGHDHQQKNALRAAEIGGYTVMQQEELVSDLLSKLETFDLRPSTRSEQARQLHKPDSADIIADIIQNTVAS